MQTVDHTKLHNTIVQKAFDVSSTFLTDSQREKLFQNKIDRARAMLQDKTRVPTTRTERQIESSVQGNENLNNTINKFKWADCRMEFLVWNKKSQHTKAYSLSVLQYEYAQVAER